MQGKVKFFNNMKGFGFIVGEDDKEYFVHISGLQEGVALEENDDVSFDVEQGDRGPKAVNVNKGAAAPAAAPAEEPADEPAEDSEDFADDASDDDASDDDDSDDEKLD